MDITEALARVPYPGRGLIVSRHDDGLALTYWLTGRSDASKNRVLIADCDNLTAAATTGEGMDPLKHYRAAMRTDRYDIVGNGSHVDEIAESTQHGVSPVEALGGCEPEPDPPIGTSRIVAVIDRSSRNVLIGAARSGPDGETDLIMLTVEQVPVGYGVLLATYSGDPERPSTWAVPTWIDTEGSVGDQLVATWASLDQRFRVAIAARSLTDGSWVVLCAD